MRQPLVALLGLTLASCLDFRKVDDAKAPGDMLGMYDVTGKLASSTCGDGALGAGNTWNFQVKLTRQENDIYWLNGQETLVGDIANDGRSFSIQSGVQVVVSQPGRGQPGCAVNRRDDAEGKLSDSGTDVESFEGTLGFSYESAKGGDCSEWVGTEGAVAVLPCSLTYALDGLRSNKAPK
jgi:hypothetical protein